MTNYERATTRETRVVEPAETVTTRTDEPVTTVRTTDRAYTPAGPRRAVRRRAASSPSSSASCRPC